MCLILTPVVYLWTHRWGRCCVAVTVFGFFTGGIWSWAPIWLPELFPTRMRGTAVAFCFNAPRWISCVGPLIAGTLIVGAWRLRSGGDDRRAVLHRRGRGGAVPARDQRPAAAARAVGRGPCAIGRIVTLPPPAIAGGRRSPAAPRCRCRSAPPTATSAAGGRRPRACGRAPRTAPNGCRCGNARRSAAAPFSAPRRTRRHRRAELGAGQRDMVVRDAAARRTARLGGGELAGSSPSGRLLTIVRTPASASASISPRSSAPAALRPGRARQGRGAKRASGGSASGCGRVAACRRPVTRKGHPKNAAAKIRRRSGPDAAPDRRRGPRSARAGAASR